MAIDPAALRALAPPIFASLDDADTRAVAERLGSVSFGAGESVFSRHDPVTGLFIVASGRLRISVSSAEGREIWTFDLPVTASATALAVAYEVNGVTYWLWCFASKDVGRLEEGVARLRKWLA